MTEIITRKAARAAGLKSYYTGKPCPHGHVVERLVADCHCTACQRERAWRHRQTPRGLEAHRDTARRDNARRDGHAPPPLERDCPPRPADGRCQDCGEPAELQMHHDHLTGAFVLWVCNRCNLKPERTIRRPADRLECELASEARRLKPP